MDARTPIAWFRFASAAALVVLALAAADRVDSARVAAIVSCVLGVVLAVLLSYRSLPPHERSRIASHRRLVRLGLLSVIAATLVASLFWVLSVVPIPGSVPVRQSVFAVVRLLDLVPSAFSLLLPSGWRSGFHQYFRNMTYCFPGSFWWETLRYLRTAIPAYALALFTVLNIGSVLSPWFRRRVAA
jgi:hypothetical protein